MIIDTTYLLPLARIDVDADLLRAVAEGQTGFHMEDIGVSLISIFELQAKSAKLGVSVEAVNRSIKAILDNFTVIPFSESDIVELSFHLRNDMTDYIDCVIIATAATRHEDLITEDSRIWKARRSLYEMYGLNVLRYRDVIGAPIHHT